MEDQLRQTNLNYYNNYNALITVSQKDIGNVKRIYTKLEQFYINHKKALSQELCDELSSVINTLFNNKYKFDFKIDLKRQKKHTILIDEYRNGAVSIVCGGAVKQTISFLSTLSILRQKDSNICWLDESFSNFGSEEIQKVPEILDMLGDMQIIFTEHKTEFQPNDSTNILLYSRELNKSTEVTYETPHLIEDVKLEIADKTVTEEDKEVLRIFNKEDEVI